MRKIFIADSIRNACPHIQLACLECLVNVTYSDTKLLNIMDEEMKKISDSLEIENIGRLPEIFAAREAYKALGKDPLRYRLSAESLLRRVVKEKGLYRVNNVVDILNLISIRSGYSIGGYDSDKIKGEIICEKGRENVPYSGIGRGILNISSLPVLSDEDGHFGTPTSDSERTMVTSGTRKFLMVFFNFSSSPNIDEWINSSEQLLKTYAFAKEFEHTVF